MVPTAQALRSPPGGGGGVDGASSAKKCFKTPIDFWLSNSVTVHVLNTNKKYKY